MTNLNQNEIAFVVTSMGCGGAERVVSILANYYASINWKVHIFMLWHNTINYQLDEKIQIHDFSSNTGSTYLRIPKLIVRLRKTLKQIAPKTVISFVAYNCVLTGIAVKGLGIRHVSSERIDPSAVNRHPLLRAAVARAYEKSSLTVLQTKRAFNYFSEKIQKNSVIIYNPVTATCEAKENRSKSFVTAGRLEPEKNHTMLIRAFARFSKTHPEYTLVIYGEGRLKNELQDLVDKLGMTDKISLPGNVSDIQERESTAGAFVLSSNREGMSNALMEAMSIGLPCISTACSGSDELITDGQNGLLIPLDDEEAMAQAMAYLAENCDNAKKMGEAAKDFSQCFSTENVIKQWRSAIEGNEYKAGDDR